MGGKIFINYRRGDDAGNTGRLFDQLQQTFGKDRLFLDVDSIAPGLNFVEVLEAQIRQCDVLIAVIGPRWLDATAPNGNRRLDDPDDFVRVEIAAALNQGKRVIPVLVGGAQMPREHELPDVLKPLAKRNAARLTHERFRADTEGLVSALQQALGDKSASQKEGPQERAQRNLGGVLVWSLGAGLIGLLAVALIWSWAPLSPLLREPPQEPAALSKECAGCPEMVKVPAGSFTLGSPATEVGRSLDEGPERLITFAQPFEVGRFAVTFDEWDACVAAGGCNAYRPADEGWGRGRRPVILVSWNDTKTYIAWLSRKTGNTYRLLTEAEREYVTRAGTTTAFWWGNSISTGQANYNGNQTYGVGPKGEYRQQTLPVDSFQPNPWGFFQVHGNVWEWVEDCFSPVIRRRRSMALLGCSEIAVDASFAAAPGGTSPGCSAPPAAAEFPSMAGPMGLAFDSREHPILDVDIAVPGFVATATRSAPHSHQARPDESRRRTRLGDQGRGRQDEGRPHQERVTVHYLLAEHFGKLSAFG